MAARIRSMDSPRCGAARLKAEQFFGVDDLAARAHAFDFLDEVAGAAWAIATLAVPQRDERDVRVARLRVAAFVEGVEEHPEIVALPDAVVRFRPQPGRQVFLIVLHARGLAQYPHPALSRMLVVELPEALDPLRP